MIELAAMMATQPLVPAPAVPAVQAESGMAVPREAIVEAEQAIVRGQFDEARAILLKLDAAPTGDRTRDNQIQFLLGMVAMQQEDYEGAIGRFRRILVSEPNAVRVRLEMGRAMFLGGRYGDAERQFMYARAGRVPSGVLANIDRFLLEIRQKKTFTYGFSIAITPDSNLNAGPATDTVTLYGLPFQLSSDAKANSGVGLTVGAHAEWAPRISRQARWRAGGQLYRAQYRKTRFDDMTLAFYTGPRLTLKRWDLSLLGSVARRWYGNRGYSIALGPAADVTYYVNPRFGLGLSASLQRIGYDIDMERNGTARSVGASFFYAPDTASFLRGAVAMGRQSARAAAYGFGSRQLSLSYIRELGGGLTIGVAPSLTAIRYDEPLAAVQRTRRDTQYSLQLSVLNRRFDFHGLTPRIAYTFTKNNSTIELYPFTRNRFEIGFTSSF